MSDPIRGEATEAEEVVGKRHEISALASVAAGWEPFAAMPNRDQGWILLLKRKAAGSQLPPP